MPALDFPNSPTVGQVFNSGGAIWTWDGVKWAGTATSPAFVLKAGDTMTGPLALPANPTTALQAATKQYVDAVSAPAWVTGNARLTFATAAQAGWIMANDGSIGDASSGATTRANADTSALFTLLYNNITSLIVQDSTGTTVSRGANAAADFAAHRRLVIPRMLGRTIAIAGSGSGLTTRALGVHAGQETETPTIAKTASHGHSVQYSGNVQAGSGGDAGVVNYVSGPGVSTNAQGSGTPLSILNPTEYLNCEIKL
jgi:hypothetical protein